MSADEASAAAAASDVAAPSSFDLLTRAVRACAADPGKKIAAREARPALLDGLGEVATIRDFASDGAWRLVTFDPGEAIVARGAHPRGDGPGHAGRLPVGGLLVLAAGSAFVEGASGRAALRPGELVGAISSATVGRSGEDARSGCAIFDAGNAADVTAGPDGASLRCLDREKVTEYASGLGDASRVIRLALRAAARAEVRALPSDAFDAGPAIVIVDAGVRGGDALATLAERNGAAAATVDFAGDLAAAANAASEMLVAAKSGAGLHPRRLDGVCLAASITFVTETADPWTLGVPDGAEDDAETASVEAFWSAVGALCAPWGTAAIAIVSSGGEGIGPRLLDLADDAAARFSEMAEVEVAPPYELGRERGSDAVEATERAFGSRDAAREWSRTRGAGVDVPRDGSDGELDRAATKIQAVHRGNASRKERREQEAAAIRIQAAHKGKAARKLAEAERSRRAKPTPTPTRNGEPTLEQIQRRARQREEAMAIRIEKVQQRGAMIRRDPSSPRRSPRRGAPRKPNPSSPPPRRPASTPSPLETTATEAPSGLDASSATAEPDRPIEATDGGADERDALRVSLVRSLVETAVARAFETAAREEREREEREEETRRREERERAEQAEAEKRTEELAREKEKEKEKEKEAEKAKEEEETTSASAVEDGSRLVRALVEAAIAEVERRARASAPASGATPPPTSSSRAKRSKPSSSGGPSASSRVFSLEASCRRLGVDPKTATSQLSRFRAPSVAVPCDPGRPDAAAAPDPSTSPVEACLFLLERRWMSFRARRALGVSEDLTLAVELAEATAALGMRPGAEPLARFRPLEGEALVRRVRLAALRAEALAPGPRDRERFRVARAEAAEARGLREALLAKRRTELASASRTRRESEEKIAAEARGAEEKERRRRRASAAALEKTLEGSFLVRLERDNERRRGNERAEGGKRLAPPFSEEADRRRDEAERRYLRSVIRDRLVAAGAVEAKEGGLPRDDAGLVAIVRANAKLLGIKWPRLVKKKKPGAETAGRKEPEKQTRSAEELERRRVARHARSRRRACEKLRREEFMRRYERDVELRRAAAREREEGALPTTTGGGATTERIRRRRARSEFGDGDGARAVPASPRSVGADVKFSAYRARLDDADAALAAMGTGAESPPTERGKGRGGGGGGGVATWTP